MIIVCCPCPAPCSLTRLRLDPKKHRSPITNQPLLTDVTATAVALPLSDRTLTHEGIVSSQAPIRGYFPRSGSRELKPPTALLIRASASATCSLAGRERSSSTQLQLVAASRDTPTMLISRLEQSDVFLLSCFFFQHFR